MNAVKAIKRDSCFPCQPAGRRRNDTAVDLQTYWSVATILQYISQVICSSLLRRGAGGAVIVVFFIVNCEAAQKTWTGTTDTAWTTASNWSPSGVPASTDTVTIVTGSNQCHLTQNTTVSRITLTSGTLQLHGFTLTVNNHSTFNGGTVSGTANPALILRGTRTTFAGTTVNAIVETISNRVELNGSTFNSKCYLEQTGGTTANGTGGNTFNDTVTLANSGTANFNLAQNTGDTYNALLKVYMTGTHDLTVSKKTSYFNGNIELNLKGSGEIYLGTSDGDSSYLASGKTISAGDSGITGGVVIFNRFVQQGNTAQTLTATSNGTSGNGVFNFISSVFHGSLTLTAPVPLFKNNVFYGTLNVTKTTNISALSDGGNRFYGDVTIDNTSAQQVRFANNTRDKYYGNVSYIGSSTGVIRPFYNDTTELHGNLSVTSNVVELDANNGIVRFAGSNNQTVSGNLTVKFKNPIVEKTGGHVTLDTSVSVSGTLKLVSGNIITTSAHLLTMLAGSSVTGASNSSFVSGPVKKVGNTGFVFPTGRIVYAPVEISTPASSTDAFTAEYVHDEEQGLYGANDTTLGRVYDNRYWNLVRNSGSASVYVTVYWDSTFYLSDTILTVASWNGSKWTNAGKGAFTGRKESGSLRSASAVNTFNAFSIAYRRTGFYYEGGIQVPCTGVASANGLQSCLNQGACVVSIANGFDINLATLPDGAFPLQIQGGTTLQGNYDPVTAPEGTLIYHDSYRGEYAGSKFKMFLFRVVQNSANPPLCSSNTVIKNIRLRGSSNTWQEFNTGRIYCMGGTGLLYENTFNLYCGGIFIEPTSGFLSYPVVIDNCEIFNFNRAAVESYGNVNEVEISNSYIHHTGGSSFIGIGYGVWARLGFTGGSSNTFRIKNTIFDNCKDAIDGSAKSNLDPMHWDINYVTLNYFAGGINRHNSNGGAPFVKMNPYISCSSTNYSFFDSERCQRCIADGQCAVCNQCGNCTFTTCQTQDPVQIFDKSPGDISIQNSYFTSPKNHINVNYPGSNNGSSNTPYNITAGNNLFGMNRRVRYEDDPNGNPCQDAQNGYLLVADNYVENDAFCEERTSGNPPRFVLDNNQFNYRPGQNVSAGLPQPPVISALLEDGSNNPLPRIYPGSNTSYITAGDPVTLRFNDGGQQVTGIFRTNPAVPTSISHYFHDQFSLNQSLNSNTHTFSGYSEPGLYGIDVMGFNNSDRIASDWQHYPVVALPAIPSDLDKKLIFHIKDSYQEFHHQRVWNAISVCTTPPPTFSLNTTGIYKQAELNGTPIWREDIAQGGDGWERVEVDLAANNNIICNCNPLALLKFDGTKNTISFSIVFDNAANDAINVNYVNGLLVWVDDVYLKRATSETGDNLIPDGTFENSVATSVLGTAYTQATPWYTLSDMPRLKDCNIQTFGTSRIDQPEVELTELESSYSVTITCPSSTTNNPVVEAGRANIASTEKKSGKQALMLKLNRFELSNPAACDNYSLCNYDNNFAFIRVVTACTDIDFTDLLSCSDFGYTSLITELNNCTSSTCTLTAGNFYLDQDITLPYTNNNGTVNSLWLKGCNLAIEAGKKITVGTGGILRTAFYNTVTPNRITSLFSCNDMWEGIINNGGTVELFGGGQESSYTQIKNAVTAVKNNSGTLDLRYVTFDKNKVSLELINVSSSSKIRSCRFINSDSLLRREPHAGEWILNHILLNNLNLSGTGTFTIGLPVANGQPNVVENVFEHAQWGIRAINSSFDVVNSHFSKMYSGNYTGHDIQFAPGWGAGVFAVNTGSLPKTVNFNCFETVNNNPTTYYPEFSRFSLSDNGIIALGNITLSVTGTTTPNLGIIRNRFENISRRGIYVDQLNYACSLNVSLAGMQNVYTGIYGYRATNSVVNIFNNEFTNTGYTQPTGNFSNTAITLQNPVAATGSTVSVFGNEITNCRIGIHAENVPGIKIGVDANDDLAENTIDFSVGDGSLLTGKHTGIWLQQCDNAIVKVNEIENDAVITSNEDKLRGIAADNSVNLNICGNKMTNMGYAMRFEGDCNTTRLKNNVMTDYVEGVRFVNANFSQQGNVDDPWNNEWYRSDNDYASFWKAAGTFFPSGTKNWYYSGTVSQSNPFSPDPSESQIIIPQNTNPTTIVCETAMLTNDDFDRDLVFGPVVGDSAVYDNYEDEAKYLARATLFKRLQADTSLLTVGSSADSSFRAFYNTMLSANIGKFDSVSMALNTSDLVAAASINESIAEDNDIETNNKLIYDLIINKIAAGDTLDAADTTALENIFDQHWLLAGMSVYSAAAILGREYYSPELPALRQLQPEQTAPKLPEIPVIKNSVQVQPNPTNNKLFITGMAEGKNELQIYDMYGRLLYRKQAAETGSFIDVSNLVNGTYTLRLKNDEGEYFKTRFVLLK